MSDLEVVAFDPGGTTGIAYFINGHPVIEEITSYPHIGAFITDKKPDVIVYESFQHRLNQPLKKFILLPIEVIGIIKCFGEALGSTLIAQTPATGKKFWTNDKLKKVGLYVTGVPHAMDAMRHLLQYKTFNEASDEKEYWLDRLHPRNTSAS